MDLEEGELTSDDDFGAPPAPTNSLEIHIPVRHLILLEVVNVNFLKSS